MNGKFIPGFLQLYFFFPVYIIGIWSYINLVFGFSSLFTSPFFGTLGCVWLEVEEGEGAKIPPRAHFALLPLCGDLDGMGEEGLYITKRLKYNFNPLSFT